MRAFSVLTLIALAMMAELPHLHGYSNSDALSRLIALSNTKSSTSNRERAQHAIATLQYSGIANFLCSQSLLELNPALSDLENQYSSDFTIRVTCLTEQCSLLNIEAGDDFFHPLLCKDSSESTSLVVGLYTMQCVMWLVVVVVVVVVVVGGGGGGGGGKPAYVPRNRLFS